MPAAAVSALPSLSQIRSWKTDHLTTAAAHWRNTAQIWQGATDSAYRSLERTGWEGMAYEAAIGRAGEDRRFAFGMADHLRDVLCKLATQAADQISAAQQRAVREINDAIGAGFTVGEDLSVTYDAELGSAAAATAKQSEAEAHAAEIRAAAANLAGTESDFASRITAAAAGLEFTPAAAGPSIASAAVGGTSAPLHFFGPKPLQPAPAAPPGDGQGSPGRTPFDDPKPTENNNGKPEKGGEETPGRSPYNDESGSEGDGKPEETGDGRSPYDDAEVPGETTSGGGGEGLGSTPYDDPPVTPSAPGSPIAPGGVPMSPTSPLSGGGGVPKPPSLPSSPVSPLTNPAAGAGSSTPVAPAAFDKPLQTASSSVLNNAPAPFTPPPAAPTSGSGPVAPMTSPPPQVPASTPAAAPTAPSAAAAGPVSAHPVSSVTPGTSMGPVLPPLIAGGPTASPTPLTSPPPAAPPSAPVAATSGVSAGAIGPPPMTRAEVVRRNIAKATGDSRGRVASEARALCAALHAATRSRPELLWCVGARVNGLLVVSNNIGLGWLPVNVRLPRPDGSMLASQHVFAHGEVPWQIRREWISHPVTAVKAWALHTGEPLVVVAGFEQAVGADDVINIEFHRITPDELPPPPPAGQMIGGIERLEVVNPELAADSRDKSIEALVSMLPSAVDPTAPAPDPAHTSDLWLNVTLSLNTELTTDHRIAAWHAFCEDQLAGAEDNLRHAATPDNARAAFSDHAYWRWNLEQLQ